MMLYHMNADDRTTFLQIAQPQTLPIDLTSNLPADLKTWIHDKYAPAFVSFMISQTKSKNVSWRYPLSQPEMDKVWYWWNGQVSRGPSSTLVATRWFLTLE
jgi:hypothetical protein